MNQDRKFGRVGVVGAGVMGQGIAQLAASCGLEVVMYDLESKMVETARRNIEKHLRRLVEKGRLGAEEVTASLERISSAADYAGFGDCDVVLEAVVEKIEVKRLVFRDLEKHVGSGVILATNTSSLPIASIARDLSEPGRFAGMHFFNPVPLMRLVEVIAGPASDPATVERLMALAEHLGRTPVRVEDSPGFLVNLGGRAYTTEALALLSESVAEPGDIDAVMRDCWGFRMGPFELMDLTGIDVNYPVTEIIHRAFGYDPRLRTRPQHALLLEAGRLGRKTGHGFYRYTDRGAEVTATPVESGPPPASVSLVDHDATLAALCRQAGVNILDEDDGTSPVLAAPLGVDCSTLASERDIDYRRLVAIDRLGDTSKRVTLMTAPGASENALAATAGLCSRAGRQVTAIADSPGFIGQRIVAMVVNLGCEIAQLGLATPQDIDTAMRLGLNYPDGPLGLGDAIGLAEVHSILQRLQTATGDDRYRPSMWLRRRAQLGLSATQPA
ncbi:MAG: 3-hydroxyacyl-CoA dehydrogenase [Gammaproteobacteria bacterium]|nr:3-hydroxyacyl-CoA dehydrogenase [Gammaproteobacteria bacterium]